MDSSLYPLFKNSQCIVFHFAIVFWEGGLVEIGIGRSDLKESQRYLLEEKSLIFAFLNKNSWYNILI